MHFFKFQEWGTWFGHRHKATDRVLKTITAMTILQYDITTSSVIVLKQPTSWFGDGCFHISCVPCLSTHDLCPRPPFQADSGTVCETCPRTECSCSHEANNLDFGVKRAWIRAPLYETTLSIVSLLLWPCNPDDMISFTFSDLRDLL